MPKIATSYFGNRILSHVTEDMRRLRSEGFDIVVHTFSENDFEFYKGTMRDIVTASKDAGLEVWLDPWGVGGIFAGEAYSRKALIERSWLQISADGECLPACCPNNPAFADFIQEWVEASCAMKADNIFWDEPNFYLPGGCHCEYCNSSPGIHGFLCRAMSTVRSFDKKNVVCLLPGHDAKLIGNSEFLELVDNVGTTPFWLQHNLLPETAIQELASPVIKAARAANKETHVWIQGFKVRHGREDEIADAVQAASDLKPDVTAIWGFDACASMSALACDRPAVAWQSFLTAINATRR